MSKNKTEINCVNIIKNVREITVITSACEFVVIYGIERGRGFCYLPYQEEGCSLNANDNFADVEYNTRKLFGKLGIMEEAEGIARMIREHELSLHRKGK